MKTHQNRKTKPGGRAAAVVAGCLCQTATTITGKLKKRTKAKREAAANAPNEAGPPTSKQRSHPVHADPLSFRQTIWSTSYLSPAVTTNQGEGDQNFNLQDPKQYLEIGESFKFPRFDQCPQNFKLRRNLKVLL